MFVDEFHDWIPSIYGWSNLHLVNIWREVENGRNTTDFTSSLIIHEDHAVILVVNEDILQDIYPKVNIIILCGIKPM